MENTTTMVKISAGTGSAVLDLQTPTTDVLLCSNFNYTMTASAGLKILLPAKAALNKEKLNSIKLFLKVPQSMRLDFGQKIATTAGDNVWDVPGGNFLYSFVFDNLLNRWVCSRTSNINEPDILKALFHFDDNILDETGISSITLNPGAYMFADGKFGQAIRPANSTIAGKLGEMNLGTGDFTIDYWVKTAGNISSQQGAHFTKTSNFDSNFIIGCSGFIYQSVSLSLSILNIPQNEWVHIAYCRKDGTARMFVNGIMKDSSNWGAVEINLSDWNFLCRWTTAYMYEIDELRILKGVAEWVSDFTPPVAPYTAPEETA